MSTGGYIYAIGASGTALVKIGSTQSVEKRLKTLQTGQPFALQTLAVVHVETDVRRIERQVHALLVTEHRRGEWFEMPIDEARLTALVQRAMVSLAEQDVPHTLTPLRSRREQLGLTQADVARLVGVPQSRLSEYECGKNQGMTLHTARKFAVALRCSIDYLAGLYEGYDAATVAAQTPPAAAASVPASTRAHRRGRPRKAVAGASASS